MSLMVRLKRVGSRNRPAYRVVVLEKRSKRDGKFIEEVGWYNTIKKQDNFKLKVDRIKEWVKLGAKLSPTVANLMKSYGEK